MLSNDKRSRPNGEVILFSLLNILNVKVSFCWNTTNPKQKWYIICS